MIDMEVSMEGNGHPRNRRRAWTPTLLLKLMNDDTARIVPPIGISASRNAKKSDFQNDYLELNANLSQEEGVSPEMGKSFWYLPYCRV
ncbi:hypothetical protein CDAR_518431 [Caerostris darwini]|uniref:Uncharacterized protein n=1 Tax=Caerostris darwini TaxID=1538125 RepID=A0AAV4R3F9_9ARAC|nr:hypothetical protein CDAR_518431 [Caerostris darwini]